MELPYVHFASIVAPGVEGPRRKIFLDTLRTCFDERSPTIRNGIYVIASRQQSLHV